jgi:hypothetical protein
VAIGKRNAADGTRDYGQLVPKSFFQHTRKPFRLSTRHDEHVRLRVCRRKGLAVVHEAAEMNLVLQRQVLYDLPHENFVIAGANDLEPKSRRHVGRCRLQVLDSP